MKKSLFILITTLLVNLIFAQSKFTDKIILKNGQKITVESTVNMNASVMGMDINNNTNSTNSLEVKNSTDKNYTISSTMTKLKVEVNMMGQTKSYDSEKNTEDNAELEKEFSEKLNKPIDIIVDNSTGLVTIKNQKENIQTSDAENPLKNILNVVGGNGDDAFVGTTFELIPQNKKVGDRWSDTITLKDIKTIRNYTLKSVMNGDATVELNMLTTANNKLEMQGMEMDMDITTKANNEIITNIKTGLVKKRTVQAEVTGNVQVMGQEVPVNATVTGTNIYK